jgi:hypothetical protein
MKDGSGEHAIIFSTEDLLKDLIAKENEIIEIKEKLKLKGISFCGIDEQRYQVHSGIKKISDVADNCHFNIDDDPDYPLKICVIIEGKIFHQLDKVK